MTSDTANAECKELAPPPKLSFVQKFKNGLVSALTESNPVFWAALKATEGWQEFDPSGIWRNSDPSPVIKHPKEYGLKGFSEQDLHLSTGETVTAWYKPAKGNYPTVVYFHGNSSSLDARKDFLNELSSFDSGRKFGVMIAAYPGFKGHKVRPKLEPSEPACIATGHAMVRDLVVKKGVPVKDMLFFGESLGAAVAIRVAHDLKYGNYDGRKYPIGPEVVTHSSETQNVPAVVCWGAFSSISQKVHEFYPKLPADLLIENRFDSDKIIGQIDNVLLLHGTKDEVTPCSHSVALRDASGGKAQLKLLPGANHGLYTDDPAHPGKIINNAKQMRDMIDHLQQFASTRWDIPAKPNRSKLDEELIRKASESSHTR